VADPGEEFVTAVGSNDFEAEVLHASAILYAEVRTHSTGSELGQ
jgi:hypothetical protein